MERYLYLSLLPEALIASMLPPEEFGPYLAVGTQKRTRGPAIFFDLNEFESDYFDFGKAERECVPHPDGTPKHSVYLAIYRVLEHVPLEALRSLWLVTQDGRVLELKQGRLPEIKDKFHLYQELCPVHPLIGSVLLPDDFCRFITDPSNAIYVPKICFVDLKLSEWANDPEGGRAHDLPYPNLAHIRDCLLQLRDSGKKVKTIDRVPPYNAFPYRCIRSGFVVGNRDKILHYPFPTIDQLEREYYDWWRSANV